MIEEVINFKRLELFNHYHKCDNPFLIITTKIDVTNVVNYCKKHKMFYASLGYIITKTANEIDVFKYRYDNGKFYYCDRVMSNYTEMFDDNTIGYFSVPFLDDFNEYKKKFSDVQKRFIEEKKFSTVSNLNEIWMSCLPWISFSSLVPPFDKNVTIPQFIWDRYKYDNDRYYVNLMIMVHHGFADGFHISKFVSLLEENIKLFV